MEGITDLIDEIFGDPKIKHGLKVFNDGAMKELNLVERLEIRRREEDGKIIIKCLKRNKDLVAKPEEIVRQLFLLYATTYLNYPMDQIDVETEIQMGGDRKRADIVVFTDYTQTQKYIIFEIKRPDSDSGTEQLQSYMQATGVFYGCWSNGNDVVFQYKQESEKTRGEPYNYRDISRLPKKGEHLEEVLRPLRKKDFLAEFIDSNDGLFVLRSGGEAAWNDVMCDDKWLKTHL